jgi:hypothetical protein
MDLMNKFDCKKEMKYLYAPSSKVFSVVEVPAMNYLMVDGHGDPNQSLEYQRAVEALFGVAYKIKFAFKPKAIVYTVSPLEGLWWVEDMANFSVEHKDEWDWTMMIMQPEWVTIEDFEKARQIVAKQKKNPELSRMKFEPFTEGLAVQILYWGAYADEGPTIARMHEYIREKGFSPYGKHHEIYLGDPRKTAPEKLKTILRQPVRKIA